MKKILKKLLFKTLWITVYRDCIDGSQFDDFGNCKWNDNLADVQVTEKFARQYYNERVDKSNSGMLYGTSWKSFNGWLHDYNADDVDDFYEYAKKHNAVLAICRW